MSEERKLRDAFDLLLKIQSAQSLATARQAKSVVAHLRWFDGISFEQMETDYEELWAQYKAAQKNSLTRRGKPRKLGHERRYLVAALKRAHVKGWIRRSFRKNDFNLKEAKESIGRHVSDEEIKALLLALTRHPQTRLQVLMAATMGMRKSEILKLRKEEVDLEQRFITLDPNRLKTRQARQVPIPISDDVLPILKEYVQKSGSAFVFPSEGDPEKPQCDNRFWWTYARRKAGVQCRFHDLRHSYLSNAISAGIAMEWIIKVAGATPEVVRKIYAHMRKEDLDQFRTFSKGKFV